MATDGPEHGNDMATEGPEHGNGMATERPEHGNGVAIPVLAPQPWLRCGLARLLCFPDGHSIARFHCSRRKRNAVPAAQQCCRESYTSIANCTDSPLALGTMQAYGPAPRRRRKLGCRQAVTLPAMQQGPPQASPANTGDKIDHLNTSPDDAVGRCGPVTEHAPETPPQGIHKKVRHPASSCSSSGRKDQRKPRVLCHPPHKTTRKPQMAFKQTRSFIDKPRA